MAEQHQPDLCFTKKSVADRFAPTVLDRVFRERARQEAKHGGPDCEDDNTAEDWLHFLSQRLRSAKKYARKGNVRRYARTLVELAALAVAASESLDRLQPEAFEEVQE